MHSEERERLNTAMRRLSEGDRDSLEPVYGILWPRMLRLCKGLLASQQDAEDAAQNALIKLFAQASEFDPTRDAMAWAMTLATWECRTVRRRLSRSRHVPLDAHPQSSSPDVEAEFIRAELMAALAAALEGLNATEREALTDSVSGSVLNPTQRKRKQRALARLRRLWKVVYGSE